MSQQGVSRGLQWSVVIATLLTALCPMYFAVFVVRLYLQHGQPLSAAVLAAGNSILRALAYGIAALVYAFVPRLRLWLLVIAVMGALIALEGAFGYWSFMKDRNMLTNILAEPVWEMFGRLAIAVLCVVHFAQSPRRTRASA